MNCLLRRTTAVAILCLLAGISAPAAGQDAPPQSGTAPRAPANELDAFMEKVLARRTLNRQTLEQYVLDEAEAFGIFGPGRVPLHRSRRDYTWYVREGMHVRSPVRINGVAVGDEARQKYENSWMARERSRLERKAKAEREKNPPAEDGEITISPEGLHVGGTAVVPTEPRFVSEAYFMDFKFEPGNYYFAGREQLEGQDVLRIEYYPTRMFGDDDEERGRRRREREAEGAGRSGRERPPDSRARKAEEDLERRMNKTSLVTLWVDPKEHQIVKYTFDNVWMDFLPGAWLVRVDEMRASMTMGQPFPGVWLPRGLDIEAGITLANGSYGAEYERRFSEYRLAEVATKIRVPKRSRLDPPPPPPLRPAASTPAVQSERSADVDGRADEEPPGTPRERGPWVDEAAAQPPAEVVGDIRIHGNAFLTDKEVLDAAGVAVGQPLGAGGVEAVARRLRESGRFETIDVRKRYRSLTNTADIALVIVVHEKPGVRSAIGGVDIPGVPQPVARSAGRLRSKLMFLPIVSFADGYGFTYGGRVSTVDLLGAGERLSVPLTWGGTRRAALEVERQFKTGPLTRVDSSLAVWNRENPRFDIRDQRVEIEARAERVFADLVRTGVDASRSTIDFGGLDDRLWTLGTSAAVDTRLDPAYPANAVYAGAGWTGMHFGSMPGRVNRYSGDLRGYLRVFRQVVLAGRAQYTGADAGLPLYERLLLGGSASLRGFRTGTFDGDRMLVSSAELRVPITSVLSGARLGVTAFVDAGKVWNVDQRAADAEWHRGVGGGLFLIASVVRINLDVARGLGSGGTRVHLSSGFAF